MEPGQDEERLFIRSISDYEIADGMKAQRVRCEFRSAVAHLRAGDERVNGFEDVVEDSIAAARLSAAMNSQIASRSVKTPGWRTKPLMSGVGFHSFAASGRRLPVHRWAQRDRS